VLAFLVVSFVFIIYWWDRTGFSVELIEIRKAYGFSEPTAGLLSSIFVLGLALVSIPAGVLVLRVGIHRSLVAGTIVFSLATAYTAFAHGFADMMAARIVTGVGEGMFNVAVYTYLGSITLRHRGASIGYTGFLVGVGGFTGPLVVAAALGGTGSWQVAFLILAAAGLVGAVLLVLARRRLAASADDRPDPAAERMPTGAAFRSVLRPWFVPIAVTMLVAGYLAYANIAAYESFLRGAHHFSLGLASLIVSMGGIGQLVGSVPLGHWADRTGRKFALLWSLPLAGLLMSAQYWAPGAPLLLGVLTFLTGPVNVNVYNQAYATVQDFVPRAARPVAVGTVAVFFFAGGGFAGYIFLAVAGTLGSYATASIAGFLVPALVAAALVAAVFPRAAAARTYTDQLENA
jgi:MFS family permease